MWIWKMQRIFKSTVRYIQICIYSESAAAKGKICTYQTICTHSRYFLKGTYSLHKVHIKIQNRFGMESRGRTTQVTEAQTLLFHATVSHI